MMDEPFQPLASRTGIRRKIAIRKDGNDFHSSKSDSRLANFLLKFPFRSSKSIESNIFAILIEI